MRPSRLPAKCGLQNSPDQRFAQGEGAKYPPVIYEFFTQLPSICEKSAKNNYYF
jgi:hypothetical protein